MLDDASKESRFKIIKPSSSSHDLFFHSPYQPYDSGKQPATVISLGTEMSAVIGSAGILEEGEQLLSPDFFAFIALPLPPDAEPGTTREFIPSVLRTTRDSLGPQLAQGVIEATMKQVKEWQNKEINFRWVTLELPLEPTLELQSLFREHKVDPTKGEGLRFLAFGGKTAQNQPMAKLSATVK